MKKFINRIYTAFFITTIVLMPGIVHAALTLNTFSSDPVIQNTAVVSEGRIGDLGGSATYELDIGATTSAPSQTAQFGWTSGTAQPFTLTYNNLNNLVSFTVGGNTLTYTPVSHVTVSSELYLRVHVPGSTGPINSIVLSNCVLNGTPILAKPSASSDTGTGTYVLEVSGVDLSNGFTLTGYSKMNWAATSQPQSDFAYQIYVADGRADLSILKSASPEPVFSGNTLTYTMNVMNNGPGTATGVTVTDPLPGGVIFGSASSTQGSCLQSGGIVTCNIGTISNGSSVTIIIAVTPVISGTISNTATVTGTEPDPDLSNNSTLPVQTTVIPALPSEADLNITKTDSPDPVTLVGNNVTYTITVTNNGPGSATGVTVTDTLNSLTYVSALTSQGTCSGTTTVICTIGTLTNGASATITLIAGTNPPAGMISNTAYVTLNETDPNMANNSATATTNVGDVSRLFNISTRAHVGTNLEILNGGFIVGGITPKTFLIRARGPSLSGAPYNYTGTLVNPFVKLYSFATKTFIAQNDNWQTLDPLCATSGYVCGGAVEITATGKNPCQPNPGQTTAPNGCTNESAILITLPPGNYSAIVSGVNGGTGIGLVEVFDTDGSTLPKLVNISTRARVLTGLEIENGGFIIGGGTGNKQVLIRARGPSMGDAPYNYSGTLANPFVKLYSFTTKTFIAQNDNWQTTDPLCANSGYVCGTPADITATGKDPCQPNSGQTVAPSGCNNESALLISLPPGNYSAIVSGVNSGTGLGLVEVFEITQ